MHVSFVIPFSFSFKGRNLHTTLMLLLLLLSFVFIFKYVDLDEFNVSVVSIFDWFLCNSVSDVLWINNSLFIGSFLSRENFDNKLLFSCCFSFKVFWFFNFLVLLLLLFVCLWTWSFYYIFIKENIKNILLVNSYFVILF